MMLKDKPMELDHVKHKQSDHAFDNFEAIILDNIHEPNEVWFHLCDHELDVMN